MAYHLSYSINSPQNMSLGSQSSHLLFLNDTPNIFNNCTKFTSFSSRCHTSTSSRVINSAFGQILPVFANTSKDIGETQFCFPKRSEPQEDSRLLRDIWKDIQGCNDWEGLLDPMNSHLRNEVLRYGEFAQSCYDSFDFDPHSKYCGSCKYPQVEFFEKMEMANYGYEICRHFNHLLSP